MPSLDLTNLGIFVLNMLLYTTQIILLKNNSSPKLLFQCLFRSLFNLHFYLQYWVSGVHYLELHMDKGI